MQFKKPYSSLSFYCYQQRVLVILLYFLLVSVWLLFRSVKAKGYCDSRGGEGAQPPLIRVSSGPAESLEDSPEIPEQTVPVLGWGLVTHNLFGWFKIQLYRNVTEKCNSKRQKTWSLRCRSWRLSDRWCCKMASRWDIYKIALWEFYTANHKALIISLPLLIEI